LYREGNIRTTHKPKLKFTKAMIVYTDISKAKTAEIKLVRNIYVYIKISTKLKINILKII
jgi:hypothetical protein